MIRLGRMGTITLLILLAGCGPTTDEIVAREEQVIGEHAKGMVAEMDVELTNLMVKGTREQLKDPDSAQFRNLRLARIADDEDNFAGGVLCGELNARNSMGGFVGFRPFYTDYMDGEFKLRVMNDDDRAEHFASLYRLSCQGTRSVPTP